MQTLQEFKRISLEDKPIFDAFYARYPVTHSGFMFSTMMCWQQFVQYSYLMVQDHLVISTRFDPDVSIRPPLGTPDPGILAAVVSLAAREDAHISYIQTPQRDQLAQRYPHVAFVDDRDYYDYVYKTSDLATLPGTKYAKVRNRLNKFTKATPYTIEPISKQTVDDATEFLHRWCLWKDCASDTYLDHERKAMLCAMQSFFDLGLSGLLLRINGEVEALSIFEQMNPSTAVVHFEKGSPDYDGVYKAINMETARYVQGTATSIDREEDLGLPGLRKAKLSYHPEHLVEICHIEKEQVKALVSGEDRHRP